MPSHHDEPVGLEPYRDPPGKKGFTKADAKLLAFGILALLAGVFVGQNTNQVVVHFVFATAKIRLIWVFLLCIGIGIVLDRLLTWRGVLPAASHRRPKRPREEDDQ